MDSTEIEMTFFHSMLDIFYVLYYWIFFHVQVLYAKQTGIEEKLFKMRIGQDSPVFDGVHFVLDPP